MYFNFSLSVLKITYISRNTSIENLLFGPPPNKVYLANLDLLVLLWYIHFSPITMAPLGAKYCKLMKVLNFCHFSFAK